MAAKKIRVVLDIMIDATVVDDWCTEFGLEPKEVPADVKQYLLYAAQQIMEARAPSATVSLGR